MSNSSPVNECGDQGGVLAAQTNLGWPDSGWHLQPWAWLGIDSRKTRFKDALGECELALSVLHERDLGRFTQFWDGREATGLWSIRVVSKLPLLAIWRWSSILPYKVYSTELRWHESHPKTPFLHLPPWRSGATLSEDLPLFWVLWGNRAWAFPTRRMSLSLNTVPILPTRPSHPQTWPYSGPQCKPEHPRSLSHFNTFLKPEWIIFTPTDPGSPVSRICLSSGRRGREGKDGAHSFGFF